MKKLGIFLVMLLAFLAIPFTVLAEDGENTEKSGEVEETSEESSDSEEDKEVKIYFFRGETCSHCAETEEWFESIEEEYGSKFKVIDYEVWNNEENAELMDRVAYARGEEADGVPYIIIGNHSWNGFADEYKDEILDAINSEYEKEVSSRYDIMALLPSLEKNVKEKSKSSDIVALIIIVLVVGGVTYGIIQARKKTY